LENTKSKDLFISLLGTIILLLFVSNVYFYVGFKELENKSIYMSRLSSVIGIAANSNEMSFLLSELEPSNLDELINKFEEIKPKITTKYTTKKLYSFRV